MLMICLVENVTLFAETSKELKYKVHSALQYARCAFTNLSVENKRQSSELLHHRNLLHFYYFVQGYFCVPAVAVGGGGGDVVVVLVKRCLYLFRFSVIHVKWQWCF